MNQEDFSLTAVQVQAARQGDVEASEQLFRRYLPRVTRIVAARVGRNWRELNLGDDLVQEVLLDAFLAIRDGTIRDDGAFCSWLARCVQGKLHDALRHGRTLKRGGGRVDRFADLDEAYLVDSLTEANEATPSQHATARETEARLEAALLRIDPRYREVICLRAYCRMPYRNIAEAMDLPTENTANVLFLRARAELQRQLVD